MCVCVWVCVRVCVWFYKLIHGPQKQILVFFFWDFCWNLDIRGAIASQITSITIVCSTIYLDAEQRKHQSSASLAFVRGIHRWSVNSLHKWPATRKIFHLMTSSWGCQHKNMSKHNRYHHLSWGIWIIRPWGYGRKCNFQKPLHAAIDIVSFPQNCTQKKMPPASVTFC